jgi:hypothetical protein
VTVWHNLAGVLFGVAVVGLGFLVVRKSRRIADFTIDIEASAPRALKRHGSERSREIETSLNRGFGWLAMGMGGLFALISGGVLIGRLIG